MSIDKNYEKLLKEMYQKCKDSDIPANRMIFFDEDSFNRAKAEWLSVMERDPFLNTAPPIKVG